MTIFQMKQTAQLITIDNFFISQLALHLGLFFRLFQLFWDYLAQWNRAISSPFGSRQNLFLVFLDKY